jgi:chemotaxis protein CheZ
MPVHRKRFRIEESFFGAAPISTEADGDAMPMHREIMNELRALREQMADRGDAAEGGIDPTPQQASDAYILLQTYRAQIEQCEKLKVELDLIHDAITRTKQEIAMLHGKSFDGAEMAKMTGELGAVVGGTGQRISKVMATMKFIEHHITVMMDIWGGVDAIKAHAPGAVDDRVGDARLLNGPKLAGDAGHASQDDIDAMFN